MNTVTPVDLVDLPASPRLDRAAPAHALDDLLALAPPELLELYRSARVPVLEDVHGDLRGRMLAIQGLPEPFAGAPRALASASWFPWRGKSFSPHGPVSGEGINRVVSERLRLFRFETSIGRSRAGDFDAVQLDYDLPENPFFIRPIKDEIREIDAGLWLGQAWLQLDQKAHLVLYFGLTRPPAPRASSARMPSRR
jgi:hypothetical protein